MTNTLSDLSDALADVVDALNAPGFALSAQIINDGSSGAPYRLSLTARNSGLAGRFVFDAGETALAAQNLVEAQDAVVFFGGNTGSNPLVISSSSNQVRNLVKGLTLDLHAASNNPVTVSVSRNGDNVVAELNKFAENYNGLIDKLRELTKFDATTKVKGVLLGEGAVQNIEIQMQAILYANVSGAGPYRNFADIGFTASGTNGHLVLDEEKFKAAFAANPDAVKKLFTLYEAATATTPARKGLGMLMADRLDTLIDPISGVITLQSKDLDTRTQEFQERMADMDKILEAKRLRLERQFAGMEKVLAKLQAQQSALAGLSVLQYSTPNSSAA
jgi:flagellar hook-associated protein 2